MNHNKTGKSQVTLLCFLLVFLKVILLEHFQSLFGKSNRDVFFENEGKVYYKSSRPEVFCEKGVLRNFAKFTGKHLCQSLVFIKVY